MEIHENRRKSKNIEKERLKGKQERKVVKKKKKKKKKKIKSSEAKMDAKNEKYKLESYPEKDYISADENILTQK